MRFIFLCLNRVYRPLVKKNDLEASAEKSKHILTSREKNARQNRNIKLGSKPFEIVVKLKYLRTTRTNKNCVHEGITSRFNYGISCYHLTQNILSSRLSSKNKRSKLYIIIISPVVIYEF